MSSINKNVNVERRTWDKETYEARALSRATAEESSDLPHATDKKTHDEETTPEEFQKASSERAGPMGSKRAFLKSRSNRVDLTSKLGSVEIIDPKAASNTGGITGNGVTKCSDGVGWHCRVCDCFLKDSLTYLDHINGRKHQRYLGYSMRVEKSTAEDVGSVLKGLAEKKSSEGSDIVESVDFEEVVRAREEEALQRKQERARRREERKKRARGEVVDEEQGDDNPANSNSAVDNVEEGAAAAAAEEEEEEEEEIDPNLAAMMGFSGFGGSKKK
ncbi:hypothetical protein ACHAWO_001989 [Cyclotella atomus]|jgi:U4/U6.U5 tri-snRNP component SNU23|uniref:U1-type domain-containing protein n=1 Tax=Cyclotella atomus TaxID=382360 RepID=A0ABD3NFA6_9STRA